MRIIFRVGSFLDMNEHLLKLLNHHDQMSLGCANSHFLKLATRLLYFNMVPSAYRVPYVRRITQLIDCPNVTHLHMWEVGDTDELQTKLLQLKRLRHIYIEEADIECLLLGDGLKSLTIRLTSASMRICIPSSLIFLDIAWDYDVACSGLENHPNLRSLVISGESIPEKMPPELVQLTLYGNSERSINFPNSLHVLRFYLCYDKFVEHLPSDLEEWDCGWQWNHPLPELPSSLRILKLSKKYDFPILALPTGLCHLKIRSSETVQRFWELIGRSKMPNLTELRISKSIELNLRCVTFENLPNLTSLKFHGSSRSQWLGEQHLDLSHLPLITLDIFLTVSKDLTILFPETLREFSCDCVTTNSSFKMCLPPNLRVFNLRSNSMLVPVLPSKLRVLNLNGQVTFEESAVIPSSLKIIRSSVAHMPAMWKPHHGLELLSVPGFDLIDTGVHQNTSTKF